MDDKQKKQTIDNLSECIIDALKKEKYHFAWAVFHTLMDKVNDKGQPTSAYKVNEDGLLIYSQES